MDPLQPIRDVLQHPPEIVAEWVAWQGVLVEGEALGIPFERAMGVIAISATPQHASTRLRDMAWNG